MGYTVTERLTLLLFPIEDTEEERIGVVIVEQEWGRLSVIGTQRERS